MARKNYDFVIVGGGLSGWVVARALSQLSNFHIAVVEASPILGGLAHAQNSPYGMLSYGLKVLPNTPRTEEALRFLETVLEREVSREVVSLPPMTIEKAQATQFIGFGEKAPQAIDEITYYLSPERVQTGVPVEDWIELLKQGFYGDTFTKSQVTQFEVQDGIVKTAIVNGNMRVEADNFIFCGFPGDITNLLPAGTMDPRAVQKIAKAKWWTSISLDLVHRFIPSALENIFVLAGTDFCTLGSFHKTNEDGVTHSQWLTFVDTETADEESQATALRDIKKQIKKAFPQALENVLHERILVSANSHGSLHTKMTDRMTLPGFDNLWLVSGMIHDQRNILGSLLQAKEVCMAIKALRSISSEAASGEPKVVWS